MEIETSSMLAFIRFTKFRSTMARTEWFPNCTNWAQALGKKSRKKPNLM